MFPLALTTFMNMNIREGLNVPAKGTLDVCVEIKPGHPCYQTITAVNLHIHTACCMERQRNIQCDQKNSVASPFHLPSSLLFISLSSLVQSHQAQDLSS